MEIDDFYEDKEENSVNQGEEQQHSEPEENKSQATQIQNTNLERSMQNNQEEIQKENNTQPKGSNVKESGNKKAQKNIVKKRDRQKQKNGHNPFASENNIDYRTQNIILNQKKNRHSCRASYLQNCKNDLSEGKMQRKNM